MSFLADLPSLVSLSPASSSSQNRPKTSVKISKIQRIVTYIASHETDPPQNQVITTDRTNLLLRYLSHQDQKRQSQEEVKVTTTAANFVVREESDESDEELQHGPPKKRIKYAHYSEHHSVLTSPEPARSRSSGNPHSSSSSSNVVTLHSSGHRSRHRRETRTQQ
jgi:hypothetical protein